ncbi:hypothetical protein L2Y94_08825 [Luteibacter aegosomatis]|uniref:hypothetical protein n=1 Tax=Luteibacter aegosomatis TaxID=2911537 RepID=UPI001FF721B1|nr:hypothetical protein [Luteibacter aegosomatis]UPG87439.1 hypothetical protein L2Y94_08825 [Luteibacter aegosomatis]
MARPDKNILVMDRQESPERGEMNGMPSGHAQEELMEQAIELAGFFAAHAVWCVSEGEALVPMLAHLDRSGVRSMSRLVANRLEEGVEEGKRQLEADAYDRACAVLVYDGYITLESGKTDALFIDIRAYGAPGSSATMVVPYRHRQSTRGFAVHRPKLLEYAGMDSPDYQTWADAFFRGVDSHQQGAAIWNEASDPSL